MMILHRLVIGIVVTVIWYLAVAFMRLDITWLWTVDFSAIPERTRLGVIMYVVLYIASVIWAIACSEDAINPERKP